MDNRPIGIFDSGVGGLTVLREVKKVLPAENFIYVGDTARVPYGTKSKETVTRFAAQITEFLIKKNVKLIIAACNTVSSNSLVYLKKQYSLPIIGVIEPGVKLALYLTSSKKIGIIGTQGTINSHKYKDLIKHHDKACNVYEKACPLFVPLVEDLILNNEIVDMTIKYYLRDMKQKNIDTLILGCTHYPLLDKALQKYFGTHVHLINSGYSVSLVAKEILQAKKLFTSHKKRGKVTVYASDLNENLKRLAKAVLPGDKVNIKLVSFD